MKKHRSTTHPRSQTGGGLGAKQDAKAFLAQRWIVVLALACALVTSAPAQIVVLGSYSSTLDYWTGGGGTKNGTIGGNGDGQLLVAGGSVLNLKNAYFGSGATGANTAAISLFGSGSKIIISRDLYLGNANGTGTMSISTGAYLYTGPGYTNYIGNGSAASGTMTISDLGSRWDTLDNLYVGNGGEGTLTLQNQGAFTGRNVEIGPASGTGTLNVLGSGASEHSTMTLNGFLTIHAGSDALVSNGGQLLATGNITLLGSLVVEGSGSEVTTLAQFIVSTAEGLGPVTVRDGASVTTGNTVIGNAAGESGTLNITGAGSTWKTNGAVNIGTNSSTWAVNVSDGGSFNADNIVKLYAGNTMSVSGTGSSGSFSYMDIQGILRVADGASLNFDDLYNENEIWIESGASVTIAGWLRQGDGGSIVVDGASLSIERFIPAQNNLGTLSIRDPDGGGSALTLGGDEGTTGTFYGVIQDYGGAGSFTKVGSNTVILLGDNTYTGGTTIERGHLQLGSDSPTGSILGDVVNNGGLAFQRSDDYEFSGTISGTGSVTKRGSGTLTLSGDNTYTGKTYINAGMLRLGSVNALQHSTVILSLDDSLDLNGLDATIGSLSGPGNLALGPSTITIGGNDDTTTYSGILYGTGGITKIGDGALGLTGENTFTGDTTIEAGVLLIGADGETDHTNLKKGGTAGSLAGNIVNNSELIFSRSDDFTYAGSITGSGSVEIHGSGTVILTGDSNFGGGTVVSRGRLQIGDGTTNGFITGDVSVSWVWDSAPFDVPYLVFNRSDEVTFSGIISGNGAVEQAGSGTLILTGDNTYTGDNIDTSEVTYTADDTYPGDTLISAGTLQLGNGGTTGIVAGNIVDHGTLVFNRSNNVTFSHVVSGTGDLVQRGSGKLILTGSNTYTGTTTIETGSLQLGANGNKGSVAGDIVVEGGAALIVNRSNTVTLAQKISGAGTVRQSGSGTLLLTGDNDYTGLTTVDSGKTLQLGDGGATGSIVSDMANAGTLIFNRSDDFTYDGVISGGGTVEQKGGGTLVFTGDHTYTGKTTITSGTLQLGDGGTTGSIASASVVDKSALVFNRSDEVTFSGVISGIGTVEQTGSGTLILTAANTYTGDTTVSAGTLQLGDGGATGSIASASIANAGALVFNRSNTFTYDGVISGVGTLEQAGSGTLTLTGDNSYEGDTRISAGTLQLGDGGVTGSIVSGSVANAGALVFNRSDEFSYAGVISGEGSVEQVGSGTLVFTGDHTYTGGTTINAGTLQLGNGGTTGSITGSVANEGALVFNRSDTLTYDGVISGAGSVEQAGGGTLIFTGDHTYTGTTTISAGTLQLGDDDSSGNLAGDIDIAATATFAIDTSAGSLTLSSSISGDGSLVKLSSGNLTLDVANSFSGTTTIEQGKVTIGVPNALRYSTVVVSGDYMLSLNNLSVTLGALSGTGAITLNNNRTLTVGGNGATTEFSGNIVGSGNFTKTGIGEFTLSRVQNLSGTTRINDGSIVLGIGNALQNSTVHIATDNGLDLNSLDATLGALSGSGALALGTQSLSVGRNGADTTYSGVLSGNGQLTKEGFGTLILAGDNTYTGLTTISAGALQLGTGGGTGFLSGDVANGGTLVFNRSDTDLTFTGAISGEGGVMQNGAGVLRLTGANTFTGDVTINSGQILLGSATEFADNTVVNNTTDGLDLNGFDATLGGLSGSGALALGSQSLTVGANGRDTTYAGILSGTDGSLTKTGDGTLILTGDTTYTGGTTISAGILQLGDGGSTGSLVGKIVNHASLMVNRSDALTLSGVISGTGSLTKDGDGSLTLTGTSTYSGDTIINAGQLLLNNAAALRNSTVELNVDGGLVFGSTGTTLGGLSGGGDLHPTVNTLLIGNNGESTTYSGDIIQSGGLTLYKIGSGTWTVDGSTLSIYTFTIGQGDMVFAGAGGTISTLRSSPGTSATFQDGSTLTVSSAFTGSGIDTDQITVRGADTEVTFNSLADYGPLLVDQGANLNVGTIDLDGRSITVDRGTLTLSGFATGGTDTTIALSNPGDDTALTFNLATNASFAGTISDYGDGVGSIIKTGTGTLTLSGANTFSGTTTISGGSIVLGNANALQNSTVEIGADGGLDLNGFGATIGGLSGTGDLALGSPSLSVGGSDDTTSYSGVFSGAGGLTKTGSGTLTLSGANTYGGGTTISGGTVAVTDESNLGSGTVILSNGVLLYTGDYEHAADRLIQGEGTISGMNEAAHAFRNEGTVAATGEGIAFTGYVAGNGDFTGAIMIEGTLAPGASPGTMSFEDLTLTNSSTVEIEIAGLEQGVSYDFIDVSGHATLDGTLALTLLDGFELSEGDTFVPIAWASYSGSFDTITGLIVSDGVKLTVSYLENGLSLTASAVPEPAEYAFGLALLAGLAAWWNRRRQLSAREKPDSN